jgi:hypothetical protein
LTILQVTVCLLLVLTALLQPAKMLIRKAGANVEEVVMRR